MTFEPATFEPTNISEIQHKTRATFDLYGVERVYLFGSYARGEVNAHSDIDLRIDKGNLRGFFALGGLQVDLEEVLQKKVDILLSDSLDNAFKTRIKNEEILIYEQQRT